MTTLVLALSGCGPGPASTEYVPVATPTARAEPRAPLAQASRADLGCTTTPSRCGYPDESNTGVDPDVELRPSGSVDASTPGEVIENLDVTGEINVSAPDVTIKNTRVTGGREAGNADWVVVMRPGADRLTVVDSELRTPAGSEQDLACLLNLGDGKPKVIRSNLHDCTIGVSSGGGEVVDSYIHDLSQVPGLSHVNGIASDGGGGLLVKHSTVLNEFPQTSAVALYQDFGPQSDDVLEDNLLGGGGYCVYGGAGGRGPTSHIRIVGNRFSRHFYEGCGRQGPLTYFEGAAMGNRFEGNYWDDDGTAVAGP